MDSLRHNGQQNGTGVLGGPKHRLGRFHIIRGLGEEDVGHVCLGVSIVERKPTGLDLHHYPMAWEEHVVSSRKDKAIALGLAGRDSGGMLETLAVAPPKDVHG